MQVTNKFYETLYQKKTFFYQCDLLCKFSDATRKKTKIRRIDVAWIFIFQTRNHSDQDEQPRRQGNCIKLRYRMTHWYNSCEVTTMAEETSLSKYKRVYGSVCRPSGYLSRFSEIISRTPWLTVRFSAGPHECKGTRWIIPCQPSWRGAFCRKKFSKA